MSRKIFFLYVALCSLLIARVVSYTPMFSLKQTILSRSKLGCGAMDDLNTRLKSDWKEAVKSKQKIRKGAIESITTAFKQREVDDRVAVTESLSVEIMSKLIKQRKESIKCYSDAGRTELVAQEQEEADVITSYMPVQLTEDEVIAIIDASIAKNGATSVKDMGKIMAEIRPLLMGKADIATVGGQIKARLSGK